MRVSTDAATKKTFEMLRRLGRYEIFLENVDFLRRLRISGQIDSLVFSFTYQLNNFREMPEFVDFAHSKRGDRAIFERLRNIAFSDAEYRDKAVHKREHPLHGEFLALIDNPIFQDRERVVHDFEFA